MIYYFTGTGNSLYVASRLAGLTGTRAVSIAEIMGGRPLPEEDGATGIVFPVYAWAPPKMVLDFVKKHPISSGYVFSVCTCGDEAGNAMKKLQRAMGRKPDCAYSIAMPNNYIAGFDVDPAALAEEKLEKADCILPEIAGAVNSRKRGVSKVFKGSAPGLKSAFAAPLFNRFARTAKSFYAGDGCTGCGLCGKVCPTRNVSVDGRPSWGKDCTSCLACIHHCPVQAIQRGNGTKKKGRYINPNCTVSYDFD